MTWFYRLRDWTTDQANGIRIRADYHDQECDNTARGINSSLNIAGLNSPTSNISMDGFKVTTAAAGTGASDYARLDQAQTRVVAYAADSVGTDAYAITLSPAITAYVTGQSFYFKAGTANTGAATLNINGLGAKTIKKDYNVDLSDGDISANKINQVIYDGTNFQLLSCAQGLINQSLSAIYAADAGANDTYVITLAPVPASYSTGMMINFKANTANTGAATLNVNGLGAKSIVKDGSLDLSNNDIKASQLTQVIYDGTNFQLIAPTSYLMAQDGHTNFAADAGANDTYAITLSPAPPAYVTGMVVQFKANTLNTGACTLNVNSLGAITIKKFGSTNDLVTGDILANQIVSVIYDGTNFQLISCVDDIINLTADTSPDVASDYIKTWDASDTTYKRVNPTNLAANALPAGTVLQVQQGVLTSTASTSSSTMADTGLTVSITPSSASNKVLAIASVYTCINGATNQSTFVNLVRTSTVLYRGDTASNRTRVTSDCTGSNTNINMTCSFIHYLDSPATTSSTTYKVQYAASNNAASCYINRTATDTDNSTFCRCSSSIVVLEIKG